MASVKKGTLKPHGGWERHLRWFGKKIFWKMQRQAAKKET